MRACFLAACLAFAVLAAARAEDPLATIDFCEGQLSLARDGATLAAPGIGDEVYDGDLISTGPGSQATLKLAKATGMSGSIKLAPRTSLYFNLDAIKGERQSEVELIAGQIGVKIKKLGGSPGFTVATESATCAVRGTEFDVIASPGGSILVGCSEGEVSCVSEGVSTSALPGQAVEKRVGAKIARRAVASADFAGFKEKWLADETADFARDAPKAARLIAARYLELSDRLRANHARIAADGALKAWAQEEKSGAGARISDAELERRLTEVGPLLAESRRVLGAMERIAARVDALGELVGGDSAVQGQRVRPGVTVADFFKRFEAAKDADLKRIAVLRRAERQVKRARMEREAGKRGN